MCTLNDKKIQYQNFEMESGHDLSTLNQIQTNGKLNSTEEVEVVASNTMCDFHNFGLLFAGQMHCWPQRLISTLFEMFSNGGCLKGARSVEKISNNVDFCL